MSTEERIFTLEEANSLLPRLRIILQDIAAEWGQVRALHPEIQKARDAASMDGYSPYGVTYVETVSHLMALIQQIRDMGVILKDVDKGLVDFPYVRQGKIVYLCWHLGEDAIGYWHDIEAGFAGREPLDDTDK